MNRHLLIMLLCCAVPLALIFALPYLGLTLSSSGWFVLAVLICPLMHLFMMRSHNHHDKAEGGETK